MQIWFENFFKNICACLLNNGLRLNLTNFWIMKVKHKCCLLKQLKNKDLSKEENFLQFY